MYTMCVLQVWVQLHCAIVLLCHVFVYKVNIVFLSFLISSSIFIQVSYYSVVNVALCFHFLTMTQSLL